MFLLIVICVAYHSLLDRWTQETLTRSGSSSTTAKEAPRWLLVLGCGCLAAGVGVRVSRGGRERSQKADALG